MEKEENKLKRLSCIFIGPYGENEEEQSIRNDLEMVIRAAIKDEYNFTSFPDLSNMVMTDDIFSNLISSDLVIADLRGLNSNVMYEIGLRHAYNKPILHLKDPKTKSPWDIDKNYIITYPQYITASKIEPLTEEIKKRVKKIQEISKAENPIFNSFISASRSAASLKNLSGHSDIKNVLIGISENINNMNSRLKNLEDNSNKNSGLLSTWDSLSPIRTIKDGILYNYHDNSKEDQGSISFKNIKHLKNISIDGEILL